MPCGTSAPATNFLWSEYFGDFFSICAQGLFKMQRFSGCVVDFGGRYLASRDTTLVEGPTPLSIMLRAVFGFCLSLALLLWVAYRPACRLRRRSRDSLHRRRRRRYQRHSNRISAALHSHASEQPNQQSCAHDERNSDAQHIVIQFMQKRVHSLCSTLQGIRQPVVRRLDLSDYSTARIR